MWLLFQHQWISCFTLLNIKLVCCCCLFLSITPPHSRPPKAIAINTATSNVRHKGHSWKLLMIQEAQTNQDRCQIQELPFTLLTQVHLIIAVSPEGEALITWAHCLEEQQSRRTCMGFCSVRSIRKVTEMAILASLTKAILDSPLLHLPPDLENEAEKVHSADHKRFVRNTQNQDKKMKRKKWNCFFFHFEADMEICTDILSRGIQEIGYIFMFSDSFYLKYYDLSYWDYSRTIWSFNDLLKFHFSLSYNVPILRWTRQTNMFVSSITKMPQLLPLRFNFTSLKKKLMKIRKLLRFCWNASPSKCSALLKRHK